MGAILGVLTTVLVTVPLRAADAAVIGNDYPARIANRNVDPWSFYSGECTSFVAWRINHQLRFHFDDYWLVHWGNASNWRNAARHEKVREAGVRYNHTPNVGAIAWWRAGSAGSSVGHVAWVAVVNKSSITIEEYNYLHHHRYDTRTIGRDDPRWPTGFLHFPGMRIENTTLPDIRGRVRVGETLRTTNGRWSVPDKRFAYQWFADGKPIPGATAKQFPVTRAVVNEKIRVRVTVTKKGYRKNHADSTPTRPVLPGRFTNTVPPAISGTAQVGLPLSSTTGTWSPAGSYSYQWFAAGDPVPGATARTFTPGPAQVGEKVNVRVTASGRAYNDKGKRATPVLVAPGVMRLTARPVVQGTPQIGHALTTSRATWNAAAARVRYQWYADGKPITGATTRSFTPSATQLGRRLTVAATATAPGYHRASATSAASRAVTRGTVAFHGRVKVTGHRLLGHVLAAHPPATSPAQAQVRYQWFRGRRAIRGATGRTYRTARADVGRHLHVRVAAAAPSWTTGAIRGKRLGLVRSFPTIRARASVGGPRHRWVEVSLRIRAPGVGHVIGDAIVFEGRHRLGSAKVHRGRVTVTLGTVDVGRHHLRIRFKAKGASRSGTTRLVVRAG